MDELNDILGSVENAGDDLSSWITGLFSGYGDAQGSYTPVATSAALLDDPTNALAGVGTVDTASGITNGTTGTSKLDSASSANPSRSIGSSIMEALGMAGIGKRSNVGQAHAASSAFHPSVGTMNPASILQSAANTIKDTSNPLNVFKALNNEF